MRFFFLEPTFRPGEKSIAAGQKYEPRTDPPVQSKTTTHILYKLVIYVYCRQCFRRYCETQKNSLFLKTKLFDLVLVQRKKHPFSFFFFQTKTVRISSGKTTSFFKR